MTQIATVEQILQGGRARISVARQSACAHDCHECAGCGGTAAPVRAVADNALGAKEGQKVVVETRTRQIVHILFLVYLFPILLFFLVYFALSAAGLKESSLVFFSCAAFFLGIVPAIVYDRRIRRSGGMSFTIVRIF